MTIWLSTYSTTFSPARRNHVVVAVVPVQIFRVAVALVEIGWNIVDGFARVVFDFFRARIVRENKSSPDIANGVDEESRDGGSRDRHGFCACVILIVDTGSLLSARLSDFGNRKSFVCSEIRFTGDRLQRSPVARSDRSIPGIPRVQNDRVCRLMNRPLWKICPVQARASCV